MRRTRVRGEEQKVREENLGEEGEAEMVCEKGRGAGGGERGGGGGG